MTTRAWGQLTPGEKREARFEGWLSPTGIEFSGPEAERGYKERVTRFIKAIRLEESDRVPVILPAGFFPASYAGSSLKSVMNDYDELRRAWLTFLRDFEMDSFAGPGLVFPAKVLDRLGHQLQQWPGHGLDDRVSSYQFVEGEYMKAEEYDAFIASPLDFLGRVFMPRCMSALSGFKRLAPFPLFPSMPVTYVNQFADPEVRASVLAILEAAQEGVQWQAAVTDVVRAARAKGVPSVLGSMTGAPFDLIGDSLRGTKGIMMDMHQRPEKLLQAMEAITPIAISRAIDGANASECPVVFMPLHKGCAGFMSNKQFETFYWPTLKRVMLGLIAEGLVPMPFAEGSYLPRLEYIQDLPKGAVIWYFESMDMKKAKEVLGGKACIAGNLPVSLLCTGTPQQVKEGCRSLIETCGPGGGYILTASAGMNEGNPDNLRAMMEAAKEYGGYHLGAGRAEGR